MKRVILTMVCFASLCSPVFGQYSHHSRGQTTIGIYNGTIGGYGYGQGNQPSYGYRNVPFDGRYGMARGSKPQPYMTMGNYFGLKDGDYLNPLSGSTGNSFNPVKPNGPIVTNPYMAPKGQAPTFQAVLGADGQYHVVPVK
jgi:hypothetical protein